MRTRSSKSGVQITVTDLKQYVYCPRVVYFTYCMPLIRPVTGKMEMGKDEHLRQALLEKRRKIRFPGLEHGRRRFKMRLSSSRLGLSGILDMLIETDSEMVPVEYKMSTRPPSLNHKYQLTAYAMLVEDQFGTIVRRGFVCLVPLRRAFEVSITQNMRDHVKGLVTEIKEMVATEQMPSANRFGKKCVDCEYQRFCGDL